MARYTVPQELRTETQVFKFIHLKDFAFIFIYIMLLSLFADYVNPAITTLYHIFNVIIAVILVLPSPFNKKMHIFNSLYLLFVKDNTVYKSISIKNKRGENDVF